MLSAFQEYRNSDVPSGALSETVDSIEEALKTELKRHYSILKMMVFQLALLDLVQRTISFTSLGFLFVLKKEEKE